MRGTEGMNKHGAEPCGCRPGSWERGWDRGRSSLDPSPSAGRAEAKPWAMGNSPPKRGETGAGCGVRHSPGLWQTAGNGHEAPC